MFYAKLSFTSVKTNSSKIEKNICHQAVSLYEEYKRGLNKRICTRKWDRDNA